MKDAGRGFTYEWPDETETYDFYVEYAAVAEDGRHDVRIAFGKRPAYGRERVRVIVFIDGYPYAEFFGADDFESSGEMLSEIRVRRPEGERICRYPHDPIPERYTMFRVVGLPTRINYPGVHNAWAVVTNIGDHETMVAVAGLRRLERA